MNDTVFAYAKIFFAGDGVGIVKADIDGVVDNCGFVDINKLINIIDMLLLIFLFNQFTDKWNTSNHSLKYH